MKRRIQWVCGVYRYRTPEDHQALCDLMSPDRVLHHGEALMSYMYFQSHDDTEKHGSRVKRVTDWLTNPEIRFFTSGFHPNLIERVRKHIQVFIRLPLKYFVCCAPTYPLPRCFWTFWESFVFISSLNSNKRHLVRIFNKNCQQTWIIWLILSFVNKKSCPLTCLILTAKSVETISFIN